MRIIIVGGVAAGMSAATRLRRLSEKDEIIVFEKGPFVSFANCGLPYHISKTIKHRSQLIVQTADDLRSRFNIDVRVNSEVTHIDRDNKMISVNHDDQQEKLYYDKLILSLGSSPVIPKIEGLHTQSNIFQLRNIPDLDNIMSHLDESIKTVAVLGAGFIGIEVTENLIKRGFSVHLIERSNQILPNLDIEMAQSITNELIKNDVRINTGTTINKVSRDILYLDNGMSIQADAVIIAAGIRPNSDIAIAAGLKVGPNKGIVVDHDFKTSDSNIYAIGDVISVIHQITEQETLIPLAGPANRHGRQVADAIHGLSIKNKPEIGTSIVKVFSKSAASTGINEKQAKQLGLNYHVTHTFSYHHASYYPGATQVMMKLIFTNTGDIIGAQAVGNEGVDKRIDLLATAIKFRLKVDDLPELELTYAPPFGAAKDPVHISGYVAENIINSRSHNIQYNELENYRRDGYLLIDVRSSQEIRAMGLINGFINIPLEKIRDRINQIPKDTGIIVSCATGQRSYTAERIFINNGFRNVKNLDGAFSLYQLMYPQNIVK